MAAAENKGKRLSKYVDNYVVFDLETTGISSVKDDIIEISALKAVSYTHLGGADLSGGDGNSLQHGAA